MITYYQTSIQAEDELHELCKKVYLKPADYQLLDTDESESHSCLLKEKKACVQRLVTAFIQKISHIFQIEEGLTFMKDLIKGNK